MAGETILIVEDDGILALHLQDMLAGLGYRVAGPVATGEAALASAAAQCPDLILMDIELAGMMNGIATAEQIKSAADIPVVFLTGYSQDPLFQEAKLIAPYGYLIKPVPERELAVTLELALYRYNINKKLSERELALRKSEERFWHLFESSVAGVALHEIICDEAGVPCDYRFLQVNPAFERATGLKTRDIVGHTPRYGSARLDLKITRYPTILTNGGAASIRTILIACSATTHWHSLDTSLCANERLPLLPLPEGGKWSVEARARFS